MRRLVSSRRRLMPQRPRKVFNRRLVVVDRRTKWNAVRQRLFSQGHSVCGCRAPFGAKSDPNATRSNTAWASGTTPLSNAAQKGGGERRSVWRGNQSMPLDRGAGAGTSPRGPVRRFIIRHALLSVVRHTRGDTGGGGVALQLPARVRHNGAKVLAIWTWDPGSHISRSRARPGGRGGGPRVALEGKGPRTGGWRGLPKRLGDGCCRLQMPLNAAPAVREAVAGHRLGALEGGGGGLTSPSSNASLGGGPDIRSPKGSRSPSSF